MNRIDGKVAVVTGGTQGVGAAIARLFAEAGAAGIVTVGRDAAKGQKVADGIEAGSGVPVEVVGAELGVMGDVRRVMAAADARFGRVDILVNAAGMSTRGNLLNTSPEIFDTLFAVNVRAPFFLMQDAARIMIREGTPGTIVNIGSTSEHAGQPILTPYSASKGALATLTRNAGFALMRNRIRVNQLDIGWTDSDNERRLQAEESGDPEFIDKAAATLPFGRLLEPAEVARAVLWVASADSGMMTGSVIQFDQSVWGAYDAQAPAPAEALTE